jgi:hypothetical protein
MSGVGTGLARSKVLAVLLALISVAVMAAALRVSDDRLPFQVLPGIADQTLAIRDGEVSAGNVRVGTQLLREGAVVSETPGLFVVVEIRLAATGNRDLSLSNPLLLTRDDRTYDTYDSSTVRAVTGFRTVGDAVFEVDPDHIDDLTLQLWETELVSGYQQRARIHLGITPQNAAAWRAAGAGTGVEPRRLGDTEAIP